MTEHLFRTPGSPAPVDPPVKIRVVIPKARRDFLIGGVAAAVAIAVPPLFPSPAQNLVEQWTKEEMDAWMEAEVLRLYRQHPQLVLATMNYVMSLRDDAPELEAGRQWLKRARASRRAVT